MSPATRCPEHELNQPCRSCRADALVAGQAHDPPPPAPTEPDGPSRAAGAAIRTLEDA